MEVITKQKVKIGLFVLCGLIILLSFVFFIGSKKNMFTKTFRVFGTFHNAGGLQTGNNVLFGGVNVGTVEDITILSDTMVRVNLIIQSKMSKFITKDAIATVGSDGLMG